MNAPRSCPTCGTTLGPSHADVLRRCTACQQLNPRGFHYCGFCAAPLGQVEGWTEHPGAPLPRPLVRSEDAPSVDHRGPDAITQPLPAPDAITKPEPIPAAVQAELTATSPSSPGPDRAGRRRKPDD